MVDMYTYYALRHIPTGFYMVEHGTGYTHYPFSDLIHSKKSIRLFSTKLGAKVALTVYCKGKMIKNQTVEEGHFEDDFGYVDEQIEIIEPDKPRLKEEYEIVVAVVCTPWLLISEEALKVVEP